MLYKQIILCAEPIYPGIWLYRNIYSRFKALKPKIFSKIKYLDEDIFTAEDHRRCDNEAAGNENIFLNINNDKSSVLSDFGGDAYASSLLGRECLWQVKKMLHSFRYADKIYQQKNLTGDAYIWPEKFSWKIYKIAKSNNFLPKYLKLPFSAMIYLKLYGLARYLWFLKRFIFFPEKIIFMSNGSIPSSKKKFVACVYLEQAFFGNRYNPLELFVDNEMINKEDVLFIHEEHEKQEWEIYASESGYNVLNMNDVLTGVNKKNFIKQKYAEISIFRIKVFLLSLLYPWAISSLSNAVRQRVIWESFYEKYDVGTTVRMMIAGDLTSSIVQMKNNTITQILFLSNQESVVKSPIYRDKCIYMDYIYMIFDQLLANKSTINWSETSQSYIKQCITVGPLFSDLVVNYRNTNLNEIKKRVGVDNDARIIAIFDNTVGHSGVLNYESYRELLKSVIRLHDEFPDLYVIFKSKKAYDSISKQANGQFTELFEQIRNHSKCIYANDFDLSTFELMAISDLVISSPISSITFESLCGGTRTILYDPIGLYAEHDITTNTFSFFNARNYSELKELVTYWLDDESGEKYEAFINNNVKVNVNANCDGNDLKRFRNVLLGNMTRSSTLHKE